VKRLNINSVADANTQRALRALQERIDELDTDTTQLDEVVSGQVSSVSGTSPIHVTPTTGDVVVSIDLSDIHDAIDAIEADMITGVTAGVNLSGGGTSGTVTLDVVDSPSFAGSVTLGNASSDSHTANGVLNVQQLRGKVQDHTTGGTQTITLAEDTTVLRINCASTIELVGITGGYDGRILLIQNVGAGNTLAYHNNGLATAADRLWLDSNGGFRYLFNSGLGLALVMYDGTSERWRLAILEGFNSGGGKTIYGDFSVSGGAAYFSSATTVAGTLDVTGDATFSNEVTVGGNMLVGDGVTDSHVFNGQTIFQGPAYGSVFNYIAGNYDLYLRGGNASSVIRVGDVNTGNILLGSTTNDTIVNGMLGVGGVTPTEYLHVRKSSAGAVGALVESTASTSAAAFVEAKDSAGRRVRMQANGASGNPFIGTITSQSLEIIAGNTRQAEFDTGGGLALSRAANTTFLSLTNGSSASVSSGSTGRLRYNTTGQVFQVSQNGAAYTPLTTGTGTTNTLTKWTGTNTIGNSTVTDDGTTFAVGTRLSSTAAVPAALTQTGTAALTISKTNTAGIRIAGGSNEIFQLGSTSGITRVDLGPSALTGTGQLILSSTGATVNGTLAVTGNVTLGDDAASDSHTVNGKLTVNTVAGGQVLVVKGASDGQSDGIIQVKSNKSGWGDITAQLTTTAGGSTSTDKLTVSVDSGSLNFSTGGLSNAAVISHAGNTTLAGALAVAGDSDLEKTTVATTFYTPGIITPSALDSDTYDDWAPTGHADAILVRVTLLLEAATTITGFEAGANPAGRHLYLEISTPGAISCTLAHQDAGSTNVNQFYCKDETSLVVDTFKSANTYHFIHTGSYWLHVGSN